MNPVYFLIILAVAGALLLMFGKAIDYEDELFRQNAVRTQGIIVTNKTCWGRIVVIRPVVRFTTQQGEVVEALDEKGLALAVPRFAEGQSIVLLYDKQNPRNFRIVTRGAFS